MDKIINKIIEIDNKAKKITEDSKKKKDEIDKYIEEELSVKQAVLEVQYKELINEKKLDYDKKIKEKEQEIEQRTNWKINKFKEKFNQEKSRIQEQIIFDIIKKVN